MCSEPYRGVSIKQFTYLLPGHERRQDEYDGGLRRIVLWYPYLNI